MGLGVLLTKLSELGINALGMADKMGDPGVKAAIMKTAILGAAGYVTASAASLMHWNFLFTAMNGPVNTIDTLGWLGSYPYLGYPFEATRQILINYWFHA